MPSRESYSTPSVPTRATSGPEAASQQERLISPHMGYYPSAEMGDTEFWSWLLAIANKPESSCKGNHAAVVRVLTPLSYLTKQRPQHFIGLCGEIEGAVTVVPLPLAVTPP